jgi:hypothetical protein
MEYFRTAGTKTLRGKPHTLHDWFDCMWLIPKNTEKQVDEQKKNKEVDK